MPTKLSLLLLVVAVSGCANSNFKPSDIYPAMPPNSSFERRVTTVWGQTEVVYKTGSSPALP